jgi:cell fate regulator YaaT (PSP1 superfamily)
MTVMPPVSMKMAKLQKSTLDPSKISGRCGRLKCCLRFEQEVYEGFQKELPPVGSRVVTAKGQGRVLAQEVLARRVLVEFEDGRRLPVAAADILTRLGR